MQKSIFIRNIESSDNEIIARVIRETLTEFGGNRPGTAYYDYDTDHMFEAYLAKRDSYFVAMLNGQLIGGSGIKQLAGGSDDFCELQKLYLNSAARGLGIGKQLVEKCLDFAIDAGYKKCYLETFPNMHAAIGLYKKMGFHLLDEPVGDTGHGGCDVWMLKDL